MLRAVVLLVSVLVAVPAFGQSTYVTASVGADISRFSRFDVAGVDVGGLTGGEAVSAAVRVGTSLGPAWGVELEFARPSALEEDSNSFGPVPLLASTAGVVFPQPVGFRTSLEQRITTISAMAWVRQRAAQTVDLVYLAGVGFNRTVQETTTAWSTIASVRPQRVLPSETRVTDYSTGPVVGLEARIALTEHARLVPGLRLHHIGGNVNTGWLLRLGVGLGWSF